MGIWGILRGRLAFEYSKALTAHFCHPCERPPGARRLECDVQTASVNRDELARQLVEAAYLEGDFVLASGRRSRYYFDKYRFETRPELLWPVGKLIAELIPSGTQRIAGPELRASALASVASRQAGLPSLFVRSETKQYGTAKQIEGVYEPGDRVVVVEDVMTTGQSAIKAAQALMAAGCE